MGTHEVFFAAATTLDKIEQIPRVFWLRMGIGVAGVIVTFIVIQKVLKVNKFVLSGAAFVFVGLVWFNWIYHRNEPKFLTPLVDRVAPFFPTAGAYQVKQTTLPGDTAKKKK